MKKALVALAGCVLLMAGSVSADAFKKPEPAGQAAIVPYPHRFQIIQGVAPPTEAEKTALANALGAGRLQTVPTWTNSFSLLGQSYHYTFIGAAPNARSPTIVPAVVVPIRLIIPDYSVDDMHPLVLDATKVMTSVLASPIFQPAVGLNDRQLGDAMLRAEFPHAPKHWGLSLSASVAPVLEVTMPAGTVRVIQTKSGKVLAIVKDATVINTAIRERARTLSSQSLPVFITYNALENFAFGYHSYFFAASRSEAIVYMYSSWLEHMNALLGFPADDASTLSHEIVETIHDPLLTSKTRQWGDPFGGNRCFDRLIEVSDAVEFAPSKIQYEFIANPYNGGVKLYTIQNNALLQWFTRETPSSASGHAYSFPDPTVLTSPAPLDCVSR